MGSDGKAANSSPRINQAVSRRPCGLDPACWPAFSNSWKRTRVPSPRVASDSRLCSDHPKTPPAGLLAYDSAASAHGIMLTASICTLVLVRFIEAAERPESLLQTARQRMDSRPWKVEGLVQGKDGCTISGIIFGKDFDLTVQTGDGEIVGKETRGSDRLLHLRLKVPEKLGSERERPHYWLGLTTGDQVDGVRRYEGDIAMPGGQVIRCEADYRPAPAEASIAPPARDLIKAEAATMLPAPYGKKPLGFFAIDQQKAKLDGRIVQVEMTGQVLQSEPIGGNQFRLMVKDTEKRYGLIEISRQGMEKLELTGEGASKPLTLYVRISYLGRKPAARATAVGARFARANDKEGTYTWE